MKKTFKTLSILMAALMLTSLMPPAFAKTSSEPVYAAERTIPFPHNKQIDWLGNSDPNPDAGETPAEELQDTYRAYLDWSAMPSDPADLLFVVDTSSIMLDEMDGTPNTVMQSGKPVANPNWNAANSRKAAVEQMLNGSGDGSGLIEKFLQKNEQNKVSVMTFDSVSECEMEIKWVPVVDVANPRDMRANKVYFIGFNDGTYDHGLGMDAEGNLVQLPIDSLDQRQLWIAQPNANTGYVTLVNMAYNTAIGANGKEAGMQFAKYTYNNQVYFFLTVYLDQQYVLTPPDGETGFGLYPTSDANYPSKALKIGSGFERVTEYTEDDDAHLLRNWSRDTAPVTFDVKPVRYHDGFTKIYDRGRNYSEAILMADQVFGGSANAKKYMIFISAGAPNYYVLPIENYYFRGGDGGKTLGSDELSINMAAARADAFKNAYQNDDITMRSVMLNSGNVDMRAINALCNRAGETALRPGTAADLTQQLEAYINGSMNTPGNITITDEFSAYAALYGDGAIKITRRNETTDAVETVWEGANPGTGTPANNGAIQKVTAGSSKIKVIFEPDFIGSANDTYTVSYNIQVTQTAKDAYSNSGESAYDAEGEAGTDYPGNTTSAGFRGFNISKPNKCFVGYMVGSSETWLPYPTAVVQVHGVEPQPTPTPESTATPEPTPEPEPDVVFVANNLRVYQDISVGFFVKLSDAALNAENAKIRFTVNGRTVDIPVAEGDVRTVRDVQCRVFFCPVNAKEMADQVTAVFVSDTLNSDAANSCSVRDYAQKVFNHSDIYDADHPLTKLIKSTLNYGAAAQAEFGYHMDNLANSIMDETDKQVPEVTFTEVGYGGSRISDNLPDGIDCFASLMLEDLVKVRFKVNGNISGLTFKLDGETVTLTVDPEDVNSHYVETRGLYYTHLHERYDFRILRDGEELYAISYGAFDYGAAVQGAADDAELDAVMQAMYDYHLKAKAYWHY